jgi:uncharacterized protein (TIGR03083 family)
VPDPRSPNDDELRGLDPVDCMAREAARIETHLSGLPAAEWQRPSRCDGWTIRDVAAHLAAYHHACLAGSVAAFMQELAERGANDIAAFNELGIAAFADVANDELIARWSRDDAETRAGFRERGDGEVDSSVGMYPARWQAFHLAGELATHADDMFVPVSDADLHERRDWRARFSRFALTEHRPALTVTGSEGRTRVVGDGVDVVLDDDVFIEAVAGRADDLSLDPEVRVALSTMP